MPSAEQITETVHAYLDSVAKGDADLYVRKDAKPTTTSYDCRPYEDGLTAEKCDLGAGNWYVSVHGYAASTDFTLDVTRK